ncbi:DUF2312 domain-containing protein [Thalassovita mediterranea]|nr:DUF2312 domain-containing protein [Thalassovita mediterranea]
MADGNMVMDQDFDVKVQQAREIMIENDRASVSFIQRKMTIGYNRAAAIMEHLEEKGFVSKPNHAGKRELLGGNSTVTISGPGVEPITMSETEFHRAAAKAAQSVDMFPDAPEATKPPMDAGRLTEAAREKLRLTVERIERLEDEKKEVADQIKDVYAEAKAMGYDTKALRSVVKLRKIDRQEREEQDAVLETYLIALGEI